MPRDERRPRTVSEREVASPSAVRRPRQRRRRGASLLRDLRSAWDGGWSVGILLAVAAPIAAVTAVAPQVRQATDVADVSGIVTWVAVLAADLLIYLHWRMTDDRTSWLVLTLTALSVQSLELAGLVAADPHASQAHPLRILVVQLLLAVGLVAIVFHAHTHRLRVDPVLAGVGVGGVVVVLRHLLMTHAQPAHVSDDAVDVLAGAVLVLDLAIAAALFVLASAPSWVRARLACAMALLSVGHAAAFPAPSGPVSSAVTVATNVLGATLLLSLAVGLLRISWTDNRAALSLVSRRLERVEAEARADQARLHELRATVGGLGAAHRLVHDGSSLSPARRMQIQQMIDSEMARLQRLLSAGPSGPMAPVDLDATIQPIVLRHRTRGYPVRWTPSGQRAIARADHVAEVVNVLLENAVQHAAGAGASVETRCAGQVVEITVSDTGPGIARSLRPRIFEWGGRGDDSGGSGIGLHVAQELTAELGGYLELVDSSAPGATFVLGLAAEARP